MAVSGCFADGRPIEGGEGETGSDEATDGGGDAEPTGDGASATDTGAFGDDDEDGDGSSESGADEVGNSDSSGCVPGELGCACDGEACEDGAACDDGVCVGSVCGNGEVEFGEACDDGNDATSDGCEGDCTVSPGVRKIASGDSHACALFFDGRLRCWGSNLYGQLGLGHTNDVGDDEHPYTAGDVDVGASVIDVACGQRHCCAVLEGGGVRCWGNNEDNQLGYPTDPDDVLFGDEPDEVPAAAPEVELGGQAVAITASVLSTIVLLEDGTVRCFGQHSVYGVCGTGLVGGATIGDDESPADPDPLDLGGEVLAIDASYTHVCALLDGDSVRCWGSNQSGELGLGTTEDIGDDELIGAVAPLEFAEGVQAVQTGEGHTCVLLGTGAVRCWGRNDFGQLGLGAGAPVVVTDAAQAQDVPLGDDAVALASGGEHSCALLENGAVRCWGAAAWGRLGYGPGFNTEHIGDDENPSSMNPVQLSVDTAYTVEIGVWYSCVRADDGRVLCWGANSAGQIGQPDIEVALGDDETPAGIAPILLEAP